RIPFSTLAWPTAVPPGSAEKLELNTAAAAGARLAQAKRATTAIRTPNRRDRRRPPFRRSDVGPGERLRSEPWGGGRVAWGRDGVFIGVLVSRLVWPVPPHRPRRRTRDGDSSPAPAAGPSHAAAPALRRRACPRLAERHRPICRTGRFLGVAPGN